MTLRSGKRAGLLGVALAASAICAIVLTPTPAAAQSFGPGACGGGCFYADNSNETYFYNAVTSPNVSSMEWVRVNRVNPTDLTTDVFESSNNDTDIIVYDYSSSSGWSAWWQCDVLVSGSTTKCNRGRIVINTRIGNANYALSCQEQGHAFGLDHSASTGSCMFQNSTQAATDYDTHDKGHLNGYY